MPRNNRYVDFVSDEHFLDCVRRVCDAYPAPGELSIAQLRRNVIDPFKMVFDVVNRNVNVNAWLRSESIRQVDKTLNNRIGDFHQMLLGGVRGWVNLRRGDKTGLDLKKTDDSIFMELKNKFNTVNYDSLGAVRRKLERVVQRYPSATAYWAYLLAQNGESGNLVWVYEGRSNSQIREVYGKKVYELVTGDPDALVKVWSAIPKAIADALESERRLPPGELVRLQEFFAASFR